MQTAPVTSSGWQSAGWCHRWLVSSPASRFSLVTHPPWSVSAPVAHIVSYSWTGITFMSISSCKKKKYRQQELTSEMVNFVQQKMKPEKVWEASWWKQKYTEDMVTWGSEHRIWLTVEETPAIRMGSMSVVVVFSSFLLFFSGGQGGLSPPEGRFPPPTPDIVPSPARDQQTCDRCAGTAEHSGELIH